MERGLYVLQRQGDSSPYEDVVLDFATRNRTVVSKLGNLIEMGVGAIKVDFGEGAPLDAIYANGRSGLYEHNLYPLRYNKTVAEVIKKIHGENIIWARSAWAGSQRYPLHWGGDAATTETGFEGTIRSGLSIGLSGFCFWSNDIGGFVTQSPESLYRRWLPSASSPATAACTEHLHRAVVLREKSSEYFRRCAELKYKLMPYVYAQSKSAPKTWPMLRYCCWSIPTTRCMAGRGQYMFGSSTSCAHARRGSGRDVYLPDGEMDRLPDRKGVCSGWNHIEVRHPAHRHSCKGRFGHPHIPVAQCTDQMKRDKITWKKYLADEKKAEGLLCLPQDSYNGYQSHNLTYQAH